MASVPGRFLNQENIMKKVFDETSDSLRVTARIGGVDVNLSAAGGDNVAISDGVDTLLINPDGSINVNAGNIIISHTDDSIRLGDGTNLVTTTTAGPKVGLDVNVINTPTDGATETTLQALLTELGQKTEPADSQNIRALSDVIDSVSVPAIDAKLPTLGQKPSSGSVSVTLASDQVLDVNMEAFTGSQPDNVQLVGSIDGTKTGSKFGYVNNIVQQILSSHDRDQQIAYADFGTKNQRIINIDYTSPTFSGVTARKNITYTLVGTKYRRDSITWVII
jgi:hypothetical protein